MRPHSRWTTLEFRQGYLEELPVDDDSVDVVISNGVLNLTPDKPAVLPEAFRVLKPGGRLQISDIVVAREVPDDAKADVTLWTGCIAGALSQDELHRMLAERRAHPDRLRSEALRRLLGCALSIQRRRVRHPGRRHLRSQTPLARHQAHAARLST